MSSMSDVPATPNLDPARVSALQEHLLAWWQQNRRDLPWRHTRDPYEIMVSEVMLQQTQVDRVVPHYHRWLDRFPTVHALAEAPTAEVIALWAGLGYNRRAVHLQRTAQAVVERGGEFPRDVDALRQLPGIGPYTAGAIACFAFEQDVPFIDTNMRRVLHRIFLGPEIPELRASDREITEIAATVLPSGHGWDWNQALIEFGALHCTARKPLCVICPMQQECCAWPGIQTQLALQPRGTRERKEQPFRESNRYFRGRVVDALRDRRDTGITLEELGPIVRPSYTDADAPWLIEIVAGLERDGLARIAEDPAPYDSAELRIRLP
ncbi:MAG TPA: A/G-specific adenine glycosylase [Thermomicrobiales bacterium]|nr:A/G-specific adenine glycosylase [Thermomicrobiales bacterium]